MVENYESWGRYPKIKAVGVEKIFYRNEIPDLSSFTKKILPRGLGRSYGDSCLIDKGFLLDDTGMNHLIDFNKSTGIIRCEAGFSMEECLDLMVPYGWFPAATPGTKFITIAGALANDVHGKNHHRNGTFGCHVKRFELMRSDGERLVCSNDENIDLFKATIGGLGLTGLITWVEFKTQPCKGAFIYMESIKFNSLEEFFEINEESDKEFDYTVSWVDCTAQGGNMGRGLYSRGIHADPAFHKIPEEPAPSALPFLFDAPFINSTSVNIFNMLYFNKQLNKTEKSVVHYNPFFYPLDAVQNWNKAYGKNGFLQYQFVVPFENCLNTIKSVLVEVAKSGLSSFLTVLKTFGDIESPGMLSFPQPGVTMAIDFRMEGNKTLSTCRILDVIIRAAGGRLYPAKDARMNGEDFRNFYPNWKEFSEFIDPKFTSAFWERVMR